MDSSSRRPQRLFVTGATGFIGRVLLEQLARESIHEIICLVRRRPREDEAGAARYVVGDITVPESFSASLEGVDTVIHLAAATGAATAADLEAVNVQATASLLAACAQQRVRRFIFLSSIAATYPDTSDYPYGASKQKAESLVRSSGLAHCIVRPTIVLGKLSPNWQMLQKMAGLPVVPLIGGGRARIQPVGVEDVAKAICKIIATPNLADGPIAIGGPEVLTFGEFLHRIRGALGRPGFPHFPVPATPFRWLLAAAAALTGGRFPVGPGQVAPFVNDGIASPNPVLCSVMAEMPSLGELIRSLSTGKVHPKTSVDVLERECRSFVRYLSDRDPDPYVVRKYVEADPIIRNTSVPASALDESLIAFAIGGPQRARIADAYATAFRPMGMLRRKLIATLAILENSPAHHSAFAASTETGTVSSAFRIGVSLAAFAASLAIGIALFGPRHLLSGRAPHP